MRKLIAGIAVAATSLGMFGAASAAASGDGLGQNVINKPRCEALTLFGVSGEWSNNEGIKSCTFTFEDIRLLDLSYELREQILQVGSLPGVRITTTVEGTLRITLDLDAVIGASQRGNVGAPGTIDTLRPIVQLLFDLNVWWENCRTNIRTEGQTPPIFIPPFINIPAGPVVVLSDVNIPSPDEVCTAALIASLLP